MSMVPATCTVCGNGYDLEIRDTLSPRMRGLLLSMTRVCGGCSAAARVAREAEESAVRAEEMRSLHEQRVRASGVPTFGRYVAEDTPATRAADRWANGQGPSTLVLTGPVGTGKSTLAAVAFRWRMRPRDTTGGIWGRVGYWRSVPVLLGQLSLGFGDRKHDQAVGLLDGSYMLGLDDLDKAKPTEYAAQQVFAAIDGCYSNGTPLIVTTNYSLGELADHWPEQYGQAIVSRLAEGEVVEMTGPDRRLRGA